MHFSAMSFLAMGPFLFSTRRIRLCSFVNVIGVISIQRARRNGKVR